MSLLEDSERADKLLKGVVGKRLTYENGFDPNMAGERGKRRKRRPKGKPDNPTKSPKFIGAAKTLGVDESGEAFRPISVTFKPKRGTKQHRQLLAGTKRMIRRGKGIMTSRTC
jgi:hypothetical protein